MSDSFDLQRFVVAQVPVYRQVIEELSHGRKRTHWMWFIFPQIAGLGFSAMAQRFAIGSRAEAVAYLEHDLLRSRLARRKQRSPVASEIRSAASVVGSSERRAALSAAQPILSVGQVHAVRAARVRGRRRRRSADHGHAGMDPPERRLRGRSQQRRNLDV